jgi:erythromycin esterase-like protein
MLSPLELLSAEQNAQVVVNGEAYFRGLWEGRGSSVDTWNLRDQHMVQTCLRLVEYGTTMGGGTAPKIVLWWETRVPPSSHRLRAQQHQARRAVPCCPPPHLPPPWALRARVGRAHNSHVGDASATSMAAVEEWNLGQMMRQTFGAEHSASSGGVFLCGLGTYTGTVTAAPEWGLPATTWQLSAAEAGSYSDLMHRALPATRDRLGARGEGLNAALVLLGVAEDEDGTREAVREALRRPRRQRAVGVCYKRETEAVSHYVQASLSTQFDAWIHVEQSTALEPLG